MSTQKCAADNSIGFFIGAPLSFVYNTDQDKKRLQNVF